MSILNTQGDKYLTKLSSLLLRDFYRSYYLFVSEVGLHKNLEKKQQKKGQRENGMCLSLEALELSESFSYLE